MIWMISILIFTLCAVNAFLNYEVQRYDGWYNNLAHPNWGSVGSRLHRKVPRYACILCFPADLLLIGTANFVNNNYSDGVYMIHQDLPCARNVSDLVFQGPDGIPNRRNITAMLAFFSQMVAYEILQSSEPSCPLEMHQIPTKTCDKVYDEECAGKTMIPFLRAKYDKLTGEGLNSPREQINEKTSWIDASFIYSTQVPWVNAMRSYVNGTLREGPMIGYPPLNSERLPLINPSPPHVHKLMDPERLFLLGDPRVNENPALLSFGLMFYRWHNVQARRLQMEHPDWSDSDLFDRARQWVIASLQNIIIYEFLPAFLNVTIDPYESYDADLPSGITHVFAAAAFRYPHTLIPPGIFLRDGHCHYRPNVGGFPAVRLCNTWWNAQEIIQQYTVDQLILGMASQVAESEDHILVNDLRDFVFGPMHFSRRDLGALTIMRGRDNGLPSYNHVRRAYHLPDRAWNEISPDFYRDNPIFFEDLKRMYHGDINNLDVYVGGMLEGDKEAPGELFTAIIKEQFLRLRNSDRFWFENQDNGIFTRDEIHMIRAISLHDIIVATTEIEPSFLQRDVFYFRAGDPCPQPYQLNSSMLESCIKLMRYDYFQGNEVPFVFSCIFVACLPLLCIAIAYAMVKHRHKYYACKDKSSISSSSNFKKMAPGDIPESNNNISHVNTTHVKFQNDCVLKPKRFITPVTEWLHEHCSRNVLLCLDDDLLLTIEKRRGGVLRKVVLDNVELVMINVSDHYLKTNEPFCQIVLPHEHDIVVKFESRSNCCTFLTHFERTLRIYGKLAKIVQRNTDLILEQAETKQKHQRKLEHFFREAYAKSFNLQDFMASNCACCNQNEYGHVSASLLRTKLSRAEFAEALSMKENDLFVQRMFNCVAREDREKICFAEFLNMVRLFTNGPLEQKLQIVFRMCDPENTGSVDRKEFTNLLSSIVKAAGSDLLDEQYEQLIESMIQSCGISAQKQVLTYDDFESIVSCKNTANKSIGLHFKGYPNCRNHNTVTYQGDETSMNSFAIPRDDRGMSLLWTKFQHLRSYLDDYRQHIFWLLIFLGATMGFFFERFFHYVLMSEHRDMRRVMGLGIAVTRGAAGAMTFSYSILPLTVCRNVMTRLRETVLNQYVPFDAAITFHKIVALVSVFFATVHTIGHIINFYHISTQGTEGLDCLFQEAVFSSDFQPSFTYWLYGTVTGITGVLLVFILSVMYIFASPSIINNAYYAFRLTHLLNVLFYLLTIVHGLPKLLDAPRFWCFLIGPAIVFVIDRILHQRSKYSALEVIAVEFLPSDVTYIEFKRPQADFAYKSGQWIKMACPAFNSKFNEWHAFSIASPPQQRSTIGVYVKAHGPWTWKFREVMQEAHQANIYYPIIHMAGPFGGGNQEWRNYEVTVMVGGGIGVTPYASILTDLVHSKYGEHHTDVVCQKVYFLWVCPTHRNFDWFIDVLRRVEAADIRQMISVHIFVTQVFHRYDLRTTMLYICEKHFQGLQNKSMFTGLKAVNHFGRPDMSTIIKHFQDKHAGLRKMGVFSCGPASLNRSVRDACEATNRTGKWPRCVHKYETF